jgi:integrase
MPQINRLSARAVATLGVGVHPDGSGLHLRVRPPHGRHWIFVWHIGPKRREAGLGAFPKVGLAVARDRAQQMRDLVAKGIDPVKERRSQLAIPTFGAMADEFIKSRTPTVRSEKSVARYERALGEKGYADALRAMRVNLITTDDVMGVLEPLWTSRPASAGIFRGYIEAVLSMAKVKGYRSGDNPAAWKGHLALLLPARQRLGRGHHAALPYAGMTSMMLALAGQVSTAARALEFLILTAGRTSEVLQATWDEFDLAERVWTVPAHRMKAEREHRVPLSDAAISLIKKLDQAGPYVFPARVGDGPLSNMAMTMVLRRLGVEATVHGFRSTFRDWAGELTEVAREVAEAALAHSVGDAAELAYRRGDALEKRRALMENWASFCFGEPRGATVIKVWDAEAAKIQRSAA